MADYTLNIAGAANAADTNKTGVTTSDRVIVNVPAMFRRVRLRVFTGTAGHRVWFRRGAAPATGLYDQLVVNDAAVVSAPSEELAAPWTIYCVPQDGTVSISAAGLEGDGWPADNSSAASSAGLSSLTSGAAFTANYLKLGSGYATIAAETGGLVLNRLPTTTTTAIATGGFVAGVAAVSNPTIEVSSTTGFAPDDIVEVYGSTSNDGFYEVAAILATPARLRVKGVGTVGATEAWTKTQVNAEAGAGTVHKVGVTVLRAGSDGLWEVGLGNTVPLTYRDVARALVDAGVKTANYNAVVGDMIGLDTNTTGSFTITMPTSPSPSTDDEIGFYQTTTHASRTVTWDGNGNSVQKADDSGFAATSAYDQVVLSAGIWRFKSGIGWVRR